MMKVGFILIMQLLSFYCECSQVKHKDFMSEFKDFAAKTRRGQNILYFENLDIDYDMFMKYNFKYRITRNSSWCEVTSLFQSIQLINSFQVVGFTNYQ